MPVMDTGDVELFFTDSQEGAVQAATEPLAPHWRRTWHRRRALGKAPALVRKRVAHLPGHCAQRVEAHRSAGVPS